MSPFQSAIILAVVGVLLIALIVRSWLRQSKSTLAGLPQPPQANWETNMEAIYVSTVSAGQTFQRVGSHTLGQRAKSVVRTANEGLLIEREGAADLFIPTRALRGSRKAAGMIGKTVGGEGLVVVRWHHDGQDLESGLRMRHRADIDQLVALIDRKELPA